MKKCIAAKVEFYITYDILWKGLLIMYTKIKLLNSY